DGRGQQHEQTEGGDQGRGPLSLDRLDERVGGVDADEHDDEQEEHHHRAGVHDDLDDPDELGLVGDVEDAGDEHDGHHAECGVHRLAREEQAEGEDHAERTEGPEQRGLTGPDLERGHYLRGHWPSSWTASAAALYSSTYARWLSDAVDTLPW